MIEYYIYHTHIYIYTYTHVSQANGHASDHRLSQLDAHTIVCRHSRYDFHGTHTAIHTIIEGHFQIFQRFSSSKLVLRTVESGPFNGSGSTTISQEFSRFRTIQILFSLNILISRLPFSRSHTHGHVRHV